MLLPLQANVILPDEPGSFACQRKHDHHTGIDLYCDPYTMVQAMESGTVVLVEPFTGPSAGSPWWNDTQTILIQGASGVIGYGEVSDVFVSKGDVVKEGQIIGMVGTSVLKTFKGRPMCMLHLECYTAGTEQSLIWELGSPQPPQLLDPTSLLPPDLERFNLSEYKGDRYRDMKAPIADAAWYARKAAVVAIQDPSGDVLMLQRSKDDRRGFPDVWCLPGGMLDNGEEPQVAAIREVQEETGIQLPDVEFSHLEYSQGTLVYVFKSQVTGGFSVTLSSEHQAYAWQKLGIGIMTGRIITSLS